MKFKILLSLLLFASVFYGQQSKGDIMISVSASPFPTTTDNNDDFGAIGMASLEFSVSNKVSFSGNFFTSNNTLIKNESNTTIHSYGFIPSIQYYFFNKEKFNVYAGLGYGFGFEDLTRGTIENSALTIISIGPGVNYKVGEKLFVKIFAPYFSARNITINEDAADGIAIFLGLNFKL
jgi:hypothetical protein